MEEDQGRLASPRLISPRSSTGKTLFDRRNGKDICGISNEQSAGRGAWFEPGPAWPWERGEVLSSTVGGLSCWRDRQALRRGVPGRPSGHQSEESCCGVIPIEILNERGAGALGRPCLSAKPGRDASGRSPESCAHTRGVGGGGGRREGTGEHRVLICSPNLPAGCPRCIQRRVGGVFLVSGFRPCCP